MQRRQFLKTLPLALPLLTACQSSPTNAFRITALKGTFPALLTQQFKKANPQASPIDLAQERQIAALFQQLQAWKRRSFPNYTPKQGLVPINLPFIGTTPELPIANLITLGDFWLTPAIRQNLIQPIDPREISQLSTLDLTLQALLKRNNNGALDPTGQLWGIPYRINSTVILYRKDQFKTHNLTPPTDWADLWRSDLTGKISLLDSPLEVIGLTLKKLGKSYNELSLPDALHNELAQLHAQVKLYSSTHYLQPLTLDHTWVALASSTDALRMIRRNPTLAAVFPQSGTILSADLWVQPASNQTPNQATLAAWCNYCLTPELAPQLSQLTQGIAPNLSQTPEKNRPEDLRTNPILSPSPEAFKRSEYVTPRSDSQLAQWRSAWEKMRKT